MISGESRYLYRGKSAKSRFEEHCLAEYAEVFNEELKRASAGSVTGAVYPQCRALR